jgi:hypothetical protein
MIYRIYILILALFGFLVSCHSTKKLPVKAVTTDTAAKIEVLVPSDHLKEDSVAYINAMYKEILDNRINVSTFSGKIDVDYRDADGKDYNVTAHLRMYKDSVIWISITAILGLEGLRAYITTDSIKLLDKQSKIYTAKSITYLQELTALPLDLSILQNLLLGNPVFLDSNITSYNKSENTVSLQSSGIFFKNLFTVGLTDKLVQNSKLNDIDVLKNRTCILTYTDYEVKKDIRFSTNRIINIVDKKKLNVKLNYKQFDFNEKLSFPFNVPKNYTRN